jgi:hypothetical protein
MVAEIARQLVGADDRPDQRGALTPVEPIEDQDRDVRLPDPRRLELRAEGDDKQHRQRHSRSPFSARLLHLLRLLPHELDERLQWRRHLVAAGIVEKNLRGSRLPVLQQ